MRFASLLNASGRLYISPLIFWFTTTIYFCPKSYSSFSSFVFLLFVRNPKKIKKGWYYFHNPHAQGNMDEQNATSYKFFSFPCSPKSKKNTTGLLTVLSKDAKTYFYLVYPEGNSHSILFNYMCLFLDVSVSVPLTSACSTCQREKV